MMKPGACFVHHAGWVMSMGLWLETCLACLALGAVSRVKWLGRKGLQGEWSAQGLDPNPFMECQCRPDKS